MTLPLAQKATDLQAIKNKIWQAANRNLQTVTMAAAGIGVMIPIETEQDGEAVLTEINRRKNRSLDDLMAPLPRRSLPAIKPVTDHQNWKQRYHDAHKLNSQREYPNAWRNGFYAPLKSKDLPDVTKHSGLIIFMVNIIRWLGGNATPFNVVTRVSDVEVTEASGNKFMDKRYTKSSRRGPADVQATIRGKKLQLDAKVGRDTPRKEQLLEQARERKAGGIYEFIYSTDEFFYVVDPLLYG